MAKATSKRKTAKAVVHKDDAYYQSTPATGQFVVLSDLHAHTWSAFAKGDGVRNSRLQAALRILRDSLQRAADMHVPWLFIGDLVHTAGYALNEVFAEITTIFMEYPDVVKLTVWGNHDARGIGGKVQFAQTALAALRRTVPNFYVLDPVVDVTYTDPKSGLTFSGAGYQPKGKLLAYPMPADVGLYHQTISGTKTPSGVVLTEGIGADELFKRHRVVLVGHVHHWQYHPAPREDQLLLIPGAPEQQSFGDSGAHGWWIVTVPPPGKEVQVEQIPGGSPEFRTVDTPKDVKKDGHFYRVRDVPAGMKLPAGVAVIAPQPTTISSRDVLHGARGHAAVQAWVKHSPPEHGDAAHYVEVGQSLLPSAEIHNLRPLRLRQLTLLNFCSYEDAQVDVQPGTWLVLGKGRDFPSNGAGKSTLFESIFWALFGRTTKGLSGDEVIRYGTSECAVSLLLEDGDGQQVRIMRTRGGKGAGLVVETPEGPLEAKSSTELTDKLAQYLGLTPALYQALGYFSQERLVLFASATDGERKEMLGDLIGLAAYQEATSAAGAQLDMLNTAEQRLAAKRTTLERQSELNRENVRAITERNAAWEKAHIQRVLAAKTAVERFKKEAPSVHAAKEQEIMGALAARTQARRHRLESEIAELQPILTAKEPAAVDVAALDRLQKQSTQLAANMDRRRGQHAAWSAAHDTLERKFKAQHKILMGGTCPSCGQAVTEEHRKACLAPLQEELMDAKAQLSTLDDALAEGQREFDAVGKAWKEAHALQEKYRAWESDQRIGNEHLQRYRAGLAELGEEERQAAAEAKKQAGQHVLDHLKVLNTYVQQAEDEVNPYAETMQEAKDRAVESEHELLDLDGELEQLQSDMACYAYWKDGFSKQGIQSLLVDEVAGLFNAVRGSIFPTLTQGVFDVQFSTTSQTKAGEWREKTEFQVLQHGETVPYSSLSGGQRRRVDVGVMLTLVMAVAQWMQTPGVLGFLVLDEVLGFLDASGAEGLMAVLREVQEKIPSIFVVSHDAQLQALFPECVIVEQDDAGVSSVSVEAA